MLQSACLRFPLDTDSLVTLSEAVARSSQEGARNVCKLLANLNRFTEQLDYIQANSLAATDSEDRFELLRTRTPYHGINALIQ